MHGATRQQISRYVKALQTQKTVPLWALANEFIVYAIAIETQPKLGPRQRKIHAIIRVACWLRSSDLIVFLLGLLTLLGALKKVRRYDRVAGHETKHIKSTFVGFGAASEEHIYTKLHAQWQEQVLRINTPTYAGCEAFGTLSFLYMLKLLYRYSFGYTRRLHRSIQEIKDHKSLYLTTCAINIGKYVFYRAFWQKARLSGNEAAWYIAFDISLFACIDENIQTNYFQHGLLSRNILIPPVDCFHLLTPDESRYIEQLYPGAKIHLRPRASDIKDRDNYLMVLSPNLFFNVRRSTLSDIAAWAESMGLTVLIRPTNSVTEEDIQIIQTAFPQAILDDVNLTLEDSFMKWRPKFVVSWYSTGLALALTYGLLPISLANPNFNGHWRHETRMNDWWVTIYHLCEKVLFWPRDQHMINESMQSENIYAQQLNQFRAN